MRNLHLWRKPWLASSSPGCSLLGVNEFENSNIFAKEDLAVVFLKAYELFLESGFPAKL